MKNAMTEQVGGTHYTSMAYQPAVFRHDIHLLANPGAIIKYVSRKKKNRLEDLNKAKHFCDICKELNDKNIWTYLHRMFPTSLETKITRFVNDNHLPLKTTTYLAIEAVAKGHWDDAKSSIEVLISDEECRVKRMEGNR